MKKLIIKSVLFAVIAAGFVTCKKEVYPEELQFLVIDSFTRKPIANATIQLIKVWRHPVKIGDNAKRDTWFPDYGRKHMIEMQSGITGSKGKLTLPQEHKKYLYILPGVSAEGYQMPSLDTLKEFKKDRANGAIYKFVMTPLIKTTFIFKSHKVGNASDSVVFSSSNKVKVMHGAQIDDRLEVYNSNSIDPYAKVWYGGTIYRNGSKRAICHYVVSYPNNTNEFVINIDL